MRKTGRLGLIRPWLADREPYAAPDTPESIAARLGIRPETLIKPEPERESVWVSRSQSGKPSTSLRS